MAGFTLLEVMVAMAILALGLTTVLSSQTGLFAAARRVQNETSASTLVRCKMSELELQLMQRGFPLLEQTDGGPCCEDEDEEGFACEWRIETVELPVPGVFEPTEPQDGEQEDLASLGDQDTDFDSELDLASTGSELNASMPLSDGSLTGATGVDDVAGSLGPASEGGGMIGMALSMVYPSLKPMLEASIRKVTVRVVWQEGKREKDLEVVQYVTNPLEGDLNPNAAEGIEDLMEKLGSDALLDSASSQPVGDEP